MDFLKQLYWKQQRRLIPWSNNSKRVSSCGVDLSFVPCLDIDWGKSEVIGNRAISSDPKLVAILCLSIINGLKSFGLKNCVKHFPGHGWAKEDSHDFCATDNRDFQKS